MRVKVTFFLLCIKKFATPTVEGAFQGYGVQKIRAFGSVDFVEGYVNVRTYSFSRAHIRGNRVS